MPVLNRTYVRGQTISVNGKIVYTLNGGTHLVVLRGDDFSYAEGTATPAGPADTRTASEGDDIRIDGTVVHVLAAGTTTVSLPGPDVVYTITGAVPLPTPTPAPPPPGGHVIRISTDALEAALRGAHDLVIEVDPMVKQTIRGNPTVSDNVTVRSSVPGLFVQIEIPAPAGSYLGIVVKGRNFLAQWLHFYTRYAGTDRKGCPATPFAFTGGGSGRLENCSADNTDKFVDLMQDHGGVQMERCESSAKTRGQGVWGGGNNVSIVDCTLRSLNEHPIRFGDDGLPNYRATNIFIRGCKLIRSINASKECLSIRKGDGPFTIIGNVCQVGVREGDAVAVGYGVRFGYDGAGYAPLRNVMFQANTIINGWLDCKGGNAKSNITFMQNAFAGTMKVTPPLQIHGTIPGLVNSGNTCNGKPI